MVMLNEKSPVEPDLYSVVYDALFVERDDLS